MRTQTRPCERPNAVQSGIIERLGGESTCQGSILLLRWDQECSKPFEHGDLLCVFASLRLCVFASLRETLDRTERSNPPPTRAGVMNVSIASGYQSRMFCSTQLWRMPRQNAASLFLGQRVIPWKSMVRRHPWEGGLATRGFRPSQGGSHGCRSFSRTFGKVTASCRRHPVDAPMA
jgi:hypothetical protein